VCLSAIAPTPGCKNARLDAKIQTNQQKTMGLLRAAVAALACVWAGQSGAELGNVYSYPEGGCSSWHPAASAQAVMIGSNRLTW
jgi:hypothetical protein